ncbi:Crp/Fnr family transcriptional regulator [Planctobacterium marinum]|uniref:Crp/Fnr family transcriptional regulator n=1 Tax=Planctobacterium marinum TaxID=1631968 RepID=UPI0030C6D14F
MKAWVQDNASLVTLTSGNSISHIGSSLECIYFPITSVIVSVAELDDNQCLCVGLIGNEGMLGIDLIPSNKNGRLKFKVIVSGTALSINKRLFLKYVAACKETDSLIRHYFSMTMHQNIRNAACCYLHDARQRLSRCLLTFGQKLHSSELSLTHSDLGDLLGIRRNTVTGFAHALQKEGLISYSRGHIFLSSQSALIRASCPCYEDEKSHQEDFFKHHGHWRYDTRN